MTFPARLVRLQFGGPLYETESWSIGLHFTGTPAPIPAEDLKAVVEGFVLGMLDDNRHATAHLDHIKFNELDHQTGKYVDQGASNAYYYPTPYAPAGAASRLAQGATCVSLRTALQRGRGHAGRIFLPGYLAPAANGKVTSGQTVIVATDVANFINSVALLSGLTAVVWSKLDDSVTPITTTRCGDVVDTQRRRRSGLIESYGASTVSIP